MRPVDDTNTTGPGGNPPAPTPTNRAVRKGMVRVRANSHIDEGGYHKPGDEFEVPEGRLAALGSLVTKIGCIAILFLLTAVASAQQYTYGVIACTNRVPDNSTDTTHVGSPITMTKYEQITIQVKYELHAAGTEASTFLFNTSVDGTNYTTGGQHKIVQVGNGTTAVCTNVTFNVGANGYIKLSSIALADTTNADMTNLVVSYSLKPVRREYGP